MAASNTIIQIRRSSTTSIPSDLKPGELAYSYLSNTLFLGNTTGTGVVNIGGLLYTQTIDQATAANTANTLVKRAADGSFAGQLYGTANLAIATVSNNTFQITGGDITASAQYFQGNNNVTLNASLNSIAGLTPGYYGNPTSIPTIQIGANGRILSVTTNTISSSIVISGNTGSSTLQTGNVLLIVGNGTGIVATETANGSGGANVVISTDNTVVRSNTTSVGPQTISTDLTVAGNLIVTGTQTFVNTSTVQTNDSLIKLAANNTVGDVVDIGFYGQSNINPSVAGSNVFHGIIREGSGGTNAGDFYVFKNLATDPTNNTVSYASLTQANLRANIISSNVSTANLFVTGSANLSTLNVSSVTNVGSINATNLSTFGNTTMAVVNTTFMNATSIQANSINIGTLTYAASGSFAAFAANSNNYQQVVIQNANNGTLASADFVVSTGISSDGTFYGDFGMNGPGFVGTGALGTANNVYLYSQNTDIAIGTTTSNAIHFVVNNGATDAMTVNANGSVAIGTANIATLGVSGVANLNSLGVVTANISALTVSGVANINSLGITNANVVNLGVSGVANIVSLGVSVNANIASLTLGTPLLVSSGGTGLNSITTYGITYGNGTGNLGVTSAAGSADQTWSNQILTVTNSGVPVWTTTMDGGSF